MAQTRIDDGSSSISYSSGWQIRASSDYWQSALHSTSTIGATATISWNGKAIVVYGTIPANPDGGSLDIEVDFILDGKANRWVKTAQPGPWHQQRLWDSGLISEGQHTFVIRNVNSRIPFQLDFFEIWGTVNNPQNPPNPNTTSKSPIPSTTKKVDPPTTSDKSAGGGDGGGGGNDNGEGDNNGGNGGNANTTREPVIITKTSVSTKPGGGLTTIVKTQTSATKTVISTLGSSVPTDLQFVNDGSSGALSATLVVVSGANGMSTVTAFRKVPPTPDAGDNGQGGPSDANGSRVGGASKLHPGVIVGLVIGGIILILLVGIIWWLLHKRRNKTVSFPQQHPVPASPSVYPFITNTNQPHDFSELPAGAISKATLAMNMSGTTQQLSRGYGETGSQRSRTGTSTTSSERIPMSPRRSTGITNEKLSPISDPFAGGSTSFGRNPSLPLIETEERLVGSVSSHSNLSYLSPVAEAPPPAYSSHRASSFYHSADTHFTGRR